LDGGTVYIILKVHVSPVGQASFFIGFLSAQDSPAHRCTCHTSCISF